ncbi:LytR/AlgR family response regulator transcription factor [Winogradskyella immobilis]|uniref:Response regulator transcription factor n=1 Tax=Winogradskyella immobilis TaxID=2816852 RepID=A0ABS8EJH3_9FLAO|nr:LytTR family DNA-binding domain-containing protein [Winogradskyella immobilis]MCC1483348.1 response regulator transcription factor [Winogradskyella immobilis]MCG0015442.1 LytTR family DNA-binding domain-containing protein [Winogradskyella immobilis]
MRVVIVEDEIVSSRRLERKLKGYNYNIITTLKSIKSAVQWFKNQEPVDLIFLDIHLEDGLCFEIFKHVEIKVPIIFTTAYSAYSIKAFDYNSVSYLLKPITKEHLEKAIEKADVFYKNENEIRVLKQIIEDENLSVYKTEFAIRVGKKIKIIKADAIECFFSLNNVTYLRANACNYVINDALINLDEKLNPKLFFKVSRKFIVNKSFINEIRSFSNNRYKVELNSYDEDEIIVSRNSSKPFKTWLGN